MTLKWGQALFAGLAITWALFWLMQSMTLNNQIGLLKTRDLKMVEFVRLKRDVRFKMNERRLPEKRLPEKRPPPPAMEISHVNPVHQTPNFDIPDLQLSIRNSRFKGPIVSGLQVGPGNISGDLIPLVRIPPRYPMRARMKRIEGWVKVEFTIDEEGAVINPIVVESHPNRVFDREALRAITKWKFKPKIETGQPIQQRAVQILEFKLKS